jgi:DNA-binding MarR family transcriptional regulator
MPRHGKERRVIGTHGVILLHIASNPEATMREISMSLGMTERQVARVIKELSEDGVIQIERQGRRNVYTINEEGHLQQPRLSSIPVKRFVQAFLGPAGAQLMVTALNLGHQASTMGAAV